MERDRELEKKIGERISTLRKQSELTQDKLAELSNCSVAFISKVERGQSAASIKLLAAIAKALKLPILELFRFDDEEFDRKVDGFVVLMRDQSGRLVEKSYTVVEKHS